MNLEFTDYLEFSGSIYGLMAVLVVSVIVLFIIKNKIVGPSRKTVNNLTYIWSFIVFVVIMTILIFNFYLDNKEINSVNSCETKYRDVSLDYADIVENVKNYSTDDKVILALIEDIKTSVKNIDDLRRYCNELSENEIAALTEKKSKLISSQRDLEELLD